MGCVFSDYLGHDDSEPSVLYAAILDDEQARTGEYGDRALDRFTRQPVRHLLLRQFFLGIPKELEEAAVLDGCNPFQIFSRIMLPLVKSALVAVVIIQLLWSWNELQWPLIINSSPEKLTLSAGLATLVSMFGTDYPVLMAGAFMAVIPMLVLFFMFQRRFIEGVAFSASKG